MNVDLNDNEGDGGRIANQLACRVTRYVTGYLMWYFLLVTPVAFFSKYPRLSRTPSRVDPPLAIQVIILAVVYDIHTGAAPQFAPRLSRLHALCDGGALDLFREGLVQVSS